MTQCYDEGVLRAYLDEELPDTERTAIASHVAGCHTCRESLDRLGDLSLEVGSLLAVPALAPDAQAALQRMPHMPSAEHELYPMQKEITASPVEHRFVPGKPISQN